jgi:hypothetical protein
MEGRYVTGSLSQTTGCEEEANGKKQQQIECKLSNEDESID